MKILLINPPYIGWLNDIKVEPVGLLYIAALCRQSGHEVHLYDPYIGDDESQYIDILQVHRPDIVACAVYTVSEGFCFDLARKCKAILPGALFVAGGPHATFCAERMLTRCPAIDVICIREAELTMLALAEWRARAGSWEELSKIDGIAFSAERGNSAARVITTAPPQVFRSVDAIPPPAKDLLSEKYYSQHSSGVLPKGFRSTGLVTARGCAYKCDFCVSPSFFTGVRKHSVERVRSEIAAMIEQRSITHIHFYDDVFAYNLKRMEAVRDAIKDLSVTWDCYIRIDCISREMLEVMKDAGCIQVRFGVETGRDNLRALRKGGKTASFADHRSVVQWCQELEIETLASYIIGFPDETRDDILETLQFADDLDTNRVGFYKLTPYPGTVYWKLMESRQIDYDKYTILENEISLNPLLTAEDLNDLVRSAYTKYYDTRAIPYDDPDTLRFLTSLPKMAY